MSRVLEAYKILGLLLLFEINKVHSYQPKRKKEIFPSDDTSCMEMTSLEKNQNFHRDFTVVFVWFSKIPQNVKKPTVVILWLFGLSGK